MVEHMPNTTGVNSNFPTKGLRSKHRILFVSSQVVKDPGLLCGFTGIETEDKLTKKMETYLIATINVYGASTKLYLNLIFAM